MAPLVSVVITIYNRADTLARAVNSVFAQSFEDWELILVDDGSKDNSVELARGYTADPRVSLIINERNRGIGGAKNVGVRDARGRYVAFLDSDDEWLPEKLARQIQHMAADDGRLLCFSGFYVVRPGENAEELERIPVRRGTWLETAVQGVDVALGSTLFARRTLFDEIGVFDESVRRMEDRDWIIRYLVTHPDFEVLPRPLARIYTGGFPRADLIRESSRQLVALNTPRLLPHGRHLPQTFASALAFDAAVAEYRSGQRISAALSALAAMAKSPAVAINNLRRLLRKVRNRDFA